MNETTNKTLIQEILWLKDRIKSLEDECSILKKKWIGSRSMAIELLNEVHKQDLTKDY